MRSLIGFALALALIGQAQAADISAWSTDDTANTATGHDGIPAAIPPSYINDWAREVMAALKRFVVDRDPYTQSTGAVNTYALAATQSFPATQQTSHATGEVFSFIAHLANTGTASLNVDSVGAKEIVRADGGQLSADDIVVGQMVNVAYSGSGDVFIMLSPAGLSGLVGQTADAASNGFSSTNLAVSRLAVPASSSMNGVMSVSITPTDADSQLVIEATLWGSNLADHWVAALFKDSSANASYVGRSKFVNTIDPETGMSGLVLRYITDAGGTTRQTWSLGYADDNVVGVAAGQLNGDQAGSAFYSGAMEANITIMEILP